MIDPLRIAAGVWLATAFMLTGCSTTLHEKRPTELDPGSRTAVKLEGPKVKLVHDF